MSEIKESRKERITINDGFRFGLGFVLANILIIVIIFICAIIFFNEQISKPKNIFEFLNPDLKTSQKTLIKSQKQIPGIQLQ